MKTYLPRFLLLASMSSLFAMSAYATVIEAVPFTIIKAGTYTLDGNLTYSGTSEAITVTASSVVIDLKGFTLTGTGPTNGQIAIYIQGPNNVTVQNGTITGFADGVDFQGGSQEVVQNLGVVNSGLSVIMQGSSYSMIQNCSIVGTGLTGDFTTNSGIYLTSSLGIIVKNCQIANAAVGGFADSGPGTNGNMFIANQLTSCGEGLDLGEGDQYQGNIQRLCGGFKGGIQVGLENGAN
jgi:hypothetical protein